MTLSLVPPIWKEAPFIRLLVPFAGGIFLQQSVDIDPFLFWILLLVSSFCLLLFHFGSLFLKLKFGWLTGSFINLLLLGTGYFICSLKDQAEDQHLITSGPSTAVSIQLTLQEPLVEKENTYKSVATVDYFSRNDSLIETEGRVIVYFEKDSQSLALGYGSSIIIKKLLSPIRSFGNPGSFDYKLYCQRQGIYYSLFLSGNHYHLLPVKREDGLKKFLFATRQKVVDIISKNITGPTESGLAKALLIGYKDDLDKNLVQAYANTGVVHIIAISGLHLGIIFWLLSLLTQPLQKRMSSKWPVAILIILGLWFFSLMAGAGPSVLRSAFMFSVIALGKPISKNSNVVNNLAFSAFALLLYNPYWLWDAGFQLSYTAVLSIVIFFRPIYNLIYFRNKIVDFAWKLCAVTLAAQVLTLPVSVYHFHQFPLYFLLSNLLAVPLSSLILIGEILLCCFSFLPQVASVIGVSLQWMILCLNDYVENINRLPFAVWDGLQISFLQLLLMFTIIAGFGIWTIHKQRTGLLLGLFSVLFFVFLRTLSFNATDQQLKLIVYNVKHGRAIDFIIGRKFQSEGDSSLLKNEVVRKLNLQPARIQWRTEESKNLEGLLRWNNLFSLGGKTILVIDHAIPVPKEKVVVDMLLLSKNPKISLSSFTEMLSPRLVVADASNSARKSASWKNECDSLGIPFYNVGTEGAYILNLR
ncbi:MAG TPA: ComEC/Rec2 family competence protein [Chitinophagaceae bacterium]|nr:ComEC/Rec2 family competence protein [Chitinophagaceae bacterium]